MVRIVAVNCNLIGHVCCYDCMVTYSVLGMGDYEHMSQWVLSMQISQLLQLLATLHMYVDFIQQSNWYLSFVD